MKVNLKVEKDNTVETFQHEIKKANIGQITGSLKVVTDIVKSIEKDEGVESFISQIVNSFGEEDMKDEEFGVVLLKSLPSVVDTLLVNVPEKVFELLAVLSGIEYETLMQQDPLDLMDIYDAVLEINDIERLIERGKKSLAGTKKLSTIFRTPATSQVTQEAQQ